MRRWLSDTALSVGGLLVPLVAVLVVEQLADTYLPAVADVRIPAPTFPSSSAEYTATPEQPLGPHVADYRWNVVLDTTEHDLHADGTITFRNRSSAPVSEVYVHLYLNAFEHEETVFRRCRRSVGAFRGSGKLTRAGRMNVRAFTIEAANEHPNWVDEDIWPTGAHTHGDVEDRTDIRVPLPGVLAPGEELTFAVQFDAELPSIFLRTGYARRFHMVAQWFPKLAKLEGNGAWAHFPFHCLSEFYADYSDYDVTISVPRGFVVGATGNRVSDEVVGTRREVRFAQSDVIDFAFAAWDEFVAVEAREGDVDIQMLVPPGYEGAARDELNVIREGLRRFGQWYGRYPYDTLTVVHPPAFATEAGGMEYPTLITTGGRWYWSALGARYVEVLTAHELGHQWFYGLIATDEHQYPFLDEGVTSYAEVRLMESLFPGGSAADVAGLRIGLGAIHRAPGTNFGRRKAVARAADEFERGSEYGQLVYRRTASLLLTLRNVYGSGLDDALATYARHGRFGHPHPADLLDAVGAHLGPAAAEQLRIGLFEQGWINLRVASLTASTAVVERQGTLAFPCDVILVDDRGERFTRRWDGVEAERRFEAPEGRSWVSATVDPSLSVLADETLLDNERRITDSQASSSAAGWGAHLAAGALTLAW